MLVDQHSSKLIRKFPLYIFLHKNWEFEIKWDKKESVDHIYSTLFLAETAYHDKF